MQQLYSVQNNLLKQLSTDYYRPLFDEINWNQRLIAIKGFRGSGKTTLLLQYLHKNDLKTSLYASFDHPYFYTHSIFDLAETFALNGGTLLILDEIHRAENWSRELKAIYDSFPELKVVFSSSSALDIFKGEADLSRRASVFELPGMSFREYLNFTFGLDIKRVTLKQLLQNHVNIAHTITKKLRPLPSFKMYLKLGYLPFAKELEEYEYSKRLINILNTVLESDLAQIQDYSASNTKKIKRLLGLLAEMVPYEPNISKIARKMQLGRDSVMNYLIALEQARILNFLNKQGKGIAALQKPDKIYLENTNLSYALKESPDVGSLRETFVLNQFINAKHDINKADKGDFIVDGGFTFEVGGKNKDDLQIKGEKDSYILADDIEMGLKQKIPLWMVGLLY